MKKSKKGFTSFAFKIPVLKIFKEEEADIDVINLASDKIDVRANKQASVLKNKKLIKYIEKQSVKKVVEPKIKIDLVS